MRHGYYSVEHRVTIDLIFSGRDRGIAIVTRIEVHPSQRGNGYASQMMERVIEDADEASMALLLSIDPDGTGLGADALRAWYERLGFKPVRADEAGKTMVRVPAGWDPTWEPSLEP